MILYSFFYNQYMKIYIDLFFLFNVIMDSIIVTGVSLLLKRKTSTFRIILSSLIGGISSLFLFTSINDIVIEIVSVIIISIVAFGYVDIRYFFRNIFYMYILSVLLGGLLYLFNIRVTSNEVVSYIIIIIISLEVMILYVKEIKKIKNIYNNYYDIDIVFKDGNKLSLIGFVDTGNNLYDPYLKRPIILVSSKYKREDNYILVPYYTAGGDGLLKCVKPSFVYIDGKRYRGSLLVGFSDSSKLLDGVDVILHKDIMKG